MNEVDKECESFIKFCNEKYNISLSDISHPANEFNEDCFVFEIKIDEKINNKALYIIESKFWVSIKCSNDAPYLIFKTHHTEKECYFLNPYLEDKETNQLNCCNSKFFNKLEKSILNKAQLLYIFNKNNQEIKNILLARSKYDMNLEKTFLEHDGEIRFLFIQSRL